MTSALLPVPDLPLHCANRRDGPTPDIPGSRSHRLGRDGNRIFRAELPVSQAVKSRMNVVALEAGRAEIFVRGGQAALDAIGRRAL